MNSNAIFGFILVQCEMSCLAWKVESKVTFSSVIAWRNSDRIAVAKKWSIWCPLHTFLASVKEVQLSWLALTSRYLSAYLLCHSNSVNWCVSLLQLCCVSLKVGKKCATCSLNAKNWKGKHRRNAEGLGAHIVVVLNIFSREWSDLHSSIFCF